jgi:hypothetical protein
MMEKIDEQVSKIITDDEEKFKDEKHYEELKEALIIYNEMLKSGIIKKRGYNLISIDQINIKQPVFNSVKCK